MATLSLARPRTARTLALGAVGFAVALALASQVAIPLPGTPVPMTLQGPVVVLAGLWLGPVAGAASMVLYLLAGITGLPVFAPMGAPGFARLLGPTGGYLIAYPAAAYIAGALGLRAKSYTGRAVAALCGVLTLFVGGALQLAILSGSMMAAVHMGVAPFLALDVVKALGAAALAPRSGPAPDSPA